MRRLAKFFRLRTEDKLLLLQCACLLLGVQCALVVFGYRRLRVFLNVRVKPGAKIVHSAGRLAWAVRAAARTLPGAACLAQAVTLQFLLGRAGHASTIRIGVAGDGRLPFDAHAWVVCEGRVMIGDAGDALARYTVLTDLELRSP